MGNNQGTLSNHLTTEKSSHLGYRILEIHPDTPASRAGLVSFFDFIVGCNDKLLFPPSQTVSSRSSRYKECIESSHIDLVAEIQKVILGQGEIELLVFNVKSRESRHVLINFQENSSSGMSLEDASPKEFKSKVIHANKTRGVGAMILLDDYGIAAEQIIRVLDVFSGSSAAKAGLLPYRDYILGSKEGPFGSIEALSSSLKKHVNHALDLYVYDAQTDFVRVVQLIPTYTQAGVFRMRKSMLGAEVVSTMIHCLPSECLTTNGSCVYAALHEEDKTIYKKQEHITAETIVDNDIVIQSRSKQKFDLDFNANRFSTLEISCSESDEDISVVTLCESLRHSKDQLGTNHSFQQNTKKDVDFMEEICKSSMKSKFEFQNRFEEKLDVGSPKSDCRSFEVESKNDSGSSTKEHLRDIKVPSRDNSTLDSLSSNSKSELNSVTLNDDRLISTKSFEDYKEGVEGKFVSHYPSFNAYASN